MRLEEVAQATAGLEQAATDAERAAASAARQQVIGDMLRAAYHQHVGELDPNNKEAWAFVKSLGKAPPLCGAAVRVHAGGTPSYRQKARAFADRYAAVSSGGRIPARVRVRRGTPLRQVTRTELSTALKALKRGRAPGADGVHAEFLLHLGPVGLHWLFYVVARSVHTGRVPQKWKNGIVVPIPKPHKDPSLVASYRPITLTSVVAKMAERVVSARLKHKTFGVMSPHQFGFTQGKSVPDAINVANETIARALDRSSWGRSRNRDHEFRHRAAAVMIDFSNAFDRVDHSILLSQLRRAGVDAHLLSAGSATSWSGA
eukprot:PhM_4_TR18024/c1_g3_i1/m.93150